MSAAPAPELLVPDLIDGISGGYWDWTADGIDCLDFGAPSCLDFGQPLQGWAGDAANVLDFCLVPDACFGDSDQDTATQAFDLGSADFSDLTGDLELPPASLLQDALPPADTEPSEVTSIVVCERGAQPKLQLNYGNVLSTWEAMGGSVVVDEHVAAQQSVQLCLPASGSANLAASLPIYDLPEESMGSPTQAANCLRKASLTSTAGCSLATATRDCSMLADCDARSDNGSDALSLVSSMRLGHPSVTFPPAEQLFGSSSSSSTSSAGLLARSVPQNVLPQSLISIPARTTECAKTARAACFVRYKEKKAHRQSGKIRYEMRKINAEKRPRFKGRFVKREELVLAELAELPPDPLVSISPRSSMCESSSWV